MSEENVVAEEAVNDGVVVDNEGQEVSADNLKDEGFSPDKKDETEYPEGLPDRLKTGEDWQQKLIKSYNELDNKMKGKGEAAPDVYEVPDDLELPQDDEVVDKFAELARDKLGLSNEKFIEVMKFAKENGVFTAPPSYEEEIKALGSEGKEIFARVGNFTAKALTPDEAKTLEGMVFTAAEARVIDKIITKSNPTMVPVNPGESTNSKADLQKELSNLLNAPDIRSNPLKKKEAEELANRIAQSK